ncbi:MAG TPA: hypothetical protein DEV93_03115 [Chloroflexi bacterium]|nr:hypothetical protein [Chloroflexota bacterium]
MPQRLGLRPGAQERHLSANTSWVVLPKPTYGATVPPHLTKRDQEPEAMQPLESPRVKPDCERPRFGYKFFFAEQRALLKDVRVLEDVPRMKLSRA